jgi:hypothetical protein
MVKQKLKVKGKKFKKGKWEEVKRYFFFTFHWPPSLECSIGLQAWEPSLPHSIGHQAKNFLLLLPLATKQGTFSFSFHWPPTLDLPSPSFSFSLKGGLGSLELFLFPVHSFQFNLENTYSHKLFEEENNDLALVVGKRKRSRMEIL